MNLLLLKNSLLVASLTMIAAGGLGFTVAIWVTGLSSRYQFGVLTVAILSLALPPFLVTNCWLDLLGQTSIGRHWVPFNIVSISGTIWILSLLLWPITFFATVSAWRRLQPSHLESDPALAGWSLVHSLLLPVARVPLLQAGALTFVLALNNFTVPAILQVKVFPADVWLRFNANPAAWPILIRSWPLIVAPLGLLLAISRSDFSWPRLEGNLPSLLFRKQIGYSGFGLCGFASILLCLVTLGLPIFNLISLKRTWIELPGAVAANQQAIWNSFWFAACSAALAIGFVIFRVAIMKTRGLHFLGQEPRWRVSVPGMLLWLPLLVPGVVLGLALIFLFNRPWIWVFYHSTGIVILGFVLRYVAVGWHTIRQASVAVNADLIDDARLNGAGRWGIFRLVHWPQIAPQAIAAGYVIFLLCLWDVETLLLIVPPGRETLALTTFNLLHYGHNPQINALCLTLLAVAIAPLVLWELLKVGRNWLVSVKRRSTSIAVLSGLLMSLITACSPQSSREAPIQSQLFSAVQIIGRRGVGVGEFNKPRSVAIDKQDNLYAVDMTGRVQRFSNGVYLLSWQMPETDLGKPKGMTRDKDGNIVVLEPHYQRLNHFAPDGKLAAQWGEKGTNAGQFMLPRSVAVNSRGEIYVSEYGAMERIQRFKVVRNTNASEAERALPIQKSKSTSVELLGEFGVPGTGPGQFNRAEGVCVDSQDRVYVADSCNHRIQIFSADGKFLRTYGKAGKQPGELSYPYDICVDSMGRQYVCEFGNSRIQIFDANDKSIEIVGHPGIEPGEFGNPWGVALDSRGNLYVADSQNHRIQKLILKGTPSKSLAITTLDGNRTGTPFLVGHSR